MNPLLNDLSNENKADLQKKLNAAYAKLQIASGAGAQQIYAMIEAIQDELYRRDAKKYLDKEFKNSDDDDDYGNLINIS